MAISFTCTCGKRLQAKDEFGGKRIKCSACQKIVTIPPKTTTPALGNLVSLACACGKRLKVKAELAGKKIKCPGCQELVPVPGKVASTMNGKPAPVSKAKAPVKLAAATKAISSPSERTSLPPKAKVAASGKVPVPVKSAPKKTIAPVKEAPVMPVDDEPEPGASTYRTPSEDSGPAPVYRPPVAPKREVDDEGDDERKKIPWGPIGGISVAVVLLSIAAWYFLSPNTGTVSGAVTLDGKSLAGAQLVFLHDDPKASPLPAATADDGTYVLYGPTSAGVPVGKYKVVITKMVRKDGKARPMGEEAVVEQSEEINVVPAEYGDFAQTPLRPEVNRGANLIPFQLRSKS